MKGSVDSLRKTLDKHLIEMKIGYDESEEIWRSIKML